MKLLYPLATASAGLLLCAAVAAQNPPSAGSLNQRIERERIEPAAESAPSLRIEQGARASTPAADQQMILITNLRITGAQIYPQAQLVALAGFSAERELTLSELHAMAARITDHYRSNGYLLAQAYLPAQEISNGEVSIAVLEGEYGEISLRNQSKLADGVVNGLIEGLYHGDTIALAPLESRLLLLSDIPGVNVRSTLVPGASVGAADLIVDVVPGERFRGGVTADSLGDRYTGEPRLGGTFNVNNPAGYGDLLSVRTLHSNAGLHYGRVAYQLPFGRFSTGVAYSHMQYRLGKEFESLDASGQATIASLYGSYPLIRSRRHNLNVQLNLDDKNFRDEAEATSTVVRKKAHVAMLSLNGDVSDGFGGGGWNAYSFTWSSGQLDIRSPAALAADATTVRSDGHYDKFAFSAARLQHVNERLSLYAAIKGQFASQNLDTSEKIGLGGLSDVSAYPSGEAYGDEGYVLKVEARTPLRSFSRHLPGELQLIGFADTGRVTVNKNPWSEGDNHRTLHSAGIGLNWTKHDDFAVSAALARRLGSEEATSAPDKKSRFWLQAVKYF
jgi:hemolysin activation/secretion protein